MDVMDGHFVPNLTLGAPIIKCLRPHTQGYLDCHLMVSHPGQWIDEFAKAGANGVTFHIECTSSQDQAVELCRRIRTLGMRSGVAMKPKTGVEEVMALCEMGIVDLVLVMTVEPGFGGQKFMPDCMTKVKAFRERFPEMDIEVDGGLAEENIGQAAEAGANVIVAGTSIFKASNPRATIQLFRDTVNSK